MKTQTQAAGCRTSPPRCSALIRRCDGCQTVTAIDLDNTLKHKRDMQMLGQTVHEVTEDEAMRLWQGAGPCRCMQNASVRGGAVAPYPGDCDDDDYMVEGCVFPGECCMPEPHYVSECHTPDIAPTRHAGAYVERVCRAFGGSTPQQPCQCGVQEVRGRTGFYAERREKPTCPRPLT